MRDVTFASLAATVGVVSQETYLFHDTVRENLRFARPEASDDEIEEAARAAHIHDLVASLPEGYDTVVGERGYRFSGGEKQRIAIARTILRNPPVLVLDEATSALDTETERAVQEALDQLAEGRTTIAIAHRLSTVRDADQIVVLDARPHRRARHARRAARARRPLRRARVPRRRAGNARVTAARVVVGILGALLVVAMLVEFFVTFLLPRRVKRDPRIARSIYRATWRPWQAFARRLPATAADTVLGFFGPLWLIGTLAIWTLGIVIGFACLFWADGSALSLHGVDFGDDLYYSASAFLSASTNLDPANGWGRALQLAEAACGFAVLFVAIGYLPALYQAFSRREVAVSRLDPRAGSPPTVGTLLLQAADRDRWDELGDYLAEWENWTAELMETHLAYPVLGYFRSQHLNQNWLASLTAVVDGCAFFLAATVDRSAGGVAPTFAIGRHALADLAHAFRVRLPEPDHERLTREQFDELHGRLSAAGVNLVDAGEAWDHLAKLRRAYEPYARGLAAALALTLPDWIPAGEVEKNWRLSAWQTRRTPRLP